MALFSWYTTLKRNSLPWLSLQVREHTLLRLQQQLFASKPNFHVDAKYLSKIVSQRHLSVFKEALTLVQDQELLNSLATLYLEGVAKRGSTDLAIFLMDQNASCGVPVEEVLHVAVRCNNLALVERLIVDGRLGKDVRLSISCELAARNGFFEMVKLLLEHGSGGVEPAAAAAMRNKHKAVVDYLMGREGFRPHSSMLSAAAGEGLLDLVEQCLKNVSQDTNYVSPDAIWAASRNGHACVVKRLLEDGRADPSYEGNRAIVDAAFFGHAELVRVLLDDGRVNPSDQANQALINASKNGHTEVVRLLLHDSRMDPSAQDDEALVGASKRGHSEVVRLLLSDRRVDPAARNNEALCSLMGNKQDAVFYLLLSDVRVDPAARSNHALRVAAEHGYVQRLSLLLQDPRTDPTAENNDALMKACNNGHVDILRLLLRHGVDPSVNNNQAIFEAAWSENLELVDMLLSDPRVDPSGKDGWESALLVAAQSGNIAVMLRLLEDPRLDPRPILLNAEIEWFHTIASSLLESKRLNCNEKELVSQLDAFCIDFLKSVANGKADRFSGENGNRVLKKIAEGFSFE
ncbi:ankyrin repeat-containing domain protein [Obelidium mucronatum]|nr:ankyrin repeat-containing domain protein [Obelidium mucronatum]